LLCYSDDLITAYLAIELQSLSFYVIASFKKNSTFSVEAGLKYFILGAFSSSLFLFGSSLIYGVSGTINFEDFKDLYFFDFPGNVLNSFDTILLQFGLIFVLSSLFFKLALAPFHIWSPDVYEGSPSSSTFFFAVVPKIALFVLLLRIFYYSFYNLLDNFRYFLVLISIFSVLIGSFVGLEQRKLKSLLAYSSISHMGYSLLAFSTGTFEGLQMLYCYLTIYMLSGLCIWSIFFLTRLKNKYSQKQNKDLADLFLLRKSNSILALSFAVVLLSIAGFPPMIGFLVKFGIFLVSIEASLYFVALISILCSVVSAFYYLRIVKVMYFEKGLSGKLYYPITSQKAIIVVLCLFFFFGLFINPTLLYLFSYKLSLLMLY
jgi:NADH-quinone oxidoreductase subunit N